MPAFALALTGPPHAWQPARAVTATGSRAIADAVHLHEALLVATARKLCGNDADAHDLVHDAYERALRGWDRYADSGNVKAWLMTILHNLFIDRCRKAKRAPKTEAIETLELAMPEPVAPPAWADVSAAEVSAALAAIGTEFRQVYELHTQGRSYDEIAAELGIAKATVGTRLLRARKKLKDALVREREAR